MQEKTAIKQNTILIRINNANTWGNTWDIMSQNITETIELVMENKYQIIDKKIQKIINEQRNETDTNIICRLKYTLRHFTLHEIVN
jgi:predicted nucleic acid-binding protein